MTPARPSRRHHRVAGVVAALVLTGSIARAAGPDPSDWDAVLETARGQTVYWHAWGGDARTNDFIAWAGERVEAEQGVSLRHVKLADTADAVAAVVGEKSAGRDAGGSVDLIWINGENFASMKDNGLLFGPWSEATPNWALVDAGNAALTSDFTVPTDGLESPWSAARVVFNYAVDRVEDPPTTVRNLLIWSAANPGRFSYPQPPDFLGTTFLKQVLLDVAADAAPLYEPVTDAAYERVATPLWEYLEALTPTLWRSGRAYPQNGPSQLRLLADAELDIAISFNPNEASAAIENLELPDTMRTFALDGGTIGNASFLAIPYNANAKAGAMVVANFLLSPEAQARAQDPAVLGSQTVLDVAALPPEDRARFDALELGVATLPPEALGPALAEPHPSWVARIEAEWEERHGVR